MIEMETEMCSSELKETDKNKTLPEFIHKNKKAVRWGM